MSLHILPVNIKSLAGSTATLENWMTSWLITMTASLMLNWSNGGQSIPPSLSLYLPTSFMTLCLTTNHTSCFNQEPLLYTRQCPRATSSSCTSERLIPRGERSKRMPSRCSMSVSFVFVHLNGVWWNGDPTTPYSKSVSRSGECAVSRRAIWWSVHWVSYIQQQLWPKE